MLLLLQLLDEFFWEEWNAACAKEFQYNCNYRAGQLDTWTIWCIPGNLSPFWLLSYTLAQKPRYHMISDRITRPLQKCQYLMKSCMTFWYSYVALLFFDILQGLMKNHFDSVKTVVINAVSSLPAMQSSSNLVDCTQPNLLF